MLEPAPDDQETALFGLLDRYLEALHAGNSLECERLLSQEPQLLCYARSLQVLDEFITPRPAPSLSRFPETQIQTLQSAAPGPRSVPDLPDSLGEYELLEDVLRSTWSTTWRARVQSTGRIVAMTFLSPHRRLTDTEIERLIHAGECRARDADGGLVRVIGSGLSHGLQYLVLEGIAGRRLAERPERTPLDPAQAARIVASVARDVDAILAAGLTLTQVDPDQILIDGGGRVFLTDYWTSLAAADTTEARSAAPLRAIGTLLADLLRLPAPFRAGPPGIDRDETRASVDPDASLLPLASICRQCVNPRAGRMYQSAGEIADDLERYLRNEPIQAAPPTWRERWTWWLLEEPTLGPRLAAVTVAAVLIEARQLLDHRPWTYHAEIKLVLLAWCGISFGFRWLAVRRPTRNIGRSSWAISDVVLASLCLCLAEPEIGPLLVVYPLLQTLTSLWRQRRLVVLSTVAGLLGIGVVLWRQGAPSSPAHYPLLTMATVVLIGLFLSFRLREPDDHSRQRSPDSRSSLPGPLS